MNREIPVGFCERLRVKVPWPTRTLVVIAIQLMAVRVKEN